MPPTRSQPGEVKKSVSVTEAWTEVIDPTRCKKRTLLILYAIRVFHKKGVNGTGIAEVMELAGVGKGQFYHYFGSKDQFICEVVRYTMDYFLERIAPYTTRLKRLDEFDQWFQPYVEFGQLPDFLGCPVGAIASELSPSNPSVRATAGLCLQRWILAMAEGLSVLQQENGAVGRFQPLEMAEELACDIQGALLMGRAMQTSRYILLLRERTRSRLAQLVQSPQN
ncbi:MAG: TetR/AcrR family transcriptional regulator [Candidatus Eremiobacteraeota bacterium]|nr:TetR/AcrR family transcriptional regulator [Candidatus Eremiobacteraeota bacterium]